MHILITGATGFIGSAVAEAAVRAGHTVFGLAHDDAAAERMAASGLGVARGDLRDTEALASLASAADAVIHAANTGGADAAAVDAAATRAILRGLHGSERPFIYTSGAWVLGEGMSDEHSPVNPAAVVAWRGPLEAEVLDAAGGLRTVVLRPGIAYGRGGGIPGSLANGTLPLVGDGSQHWPLVHVDDLADLYVRALVAPAGSVLHGVGATMRMRDLVLLGSAGQGRARPVGISLEAARAQLGVFADALALDQHISSVRTQLVVGWRPQHPSPVEEFLLGSYAGGGTARAVTA